jgi:hypothetical protein
MFKKRDYIFKYESALKSLLFNEIMKVLVNDFDRIPNKAQMLFSYAVTDYFKLHEIMFSLPNIHVELQARMLKKNHKQVKLFLSKSIYRTANPITVD